jgi:hypothetical protein
MSAEELVTVYLRCDAELRPGHSTSGTSVPCFVTFGRGDDYLATDDALDVLVRRARQKGWEVTVKNQGMKGSYVAALCPDHTEPRTRCSCPWNNGTVPPERLSHRVDCPALEKAHHAEDACGKRASAAGHRDDRLNEGSDGG